MVTGNLFLFPRGHLFTSSKKKAIQNLLGDYIMGQIAGLRREIGRFERKYGMSFQQFSDYIHDRSVLLEKGNLPADGRLNLNRAIMDEEDAWLDWKVAQEMLDNSTRFFL